MGHHTAQQFQSVLLTYKAIVAVRYPELVLHDQDPIQIGHFVPHDYTVGQGGFRAVFWEVPIYSRDLLAAIEDIVVFLNYLQQCYRDLNQGATAQLLVMCNRTAVHTHNCCNMASRLLGLAVCGLPPPRQQQEPRHE